MLENLKLRYIGDAADTDRSLAYTGEANSALGEPITTEEVRHAMMSATKNTTPGKDGITNAMIRNLDESSVKRFTEFVNEHWEQVNTSTEIFLKLGINNTVQEHIEAHLLAPKMRLMLTPTGRYTLQILGMRNACRELNNTESIPKDIRQIIEQGGLF
ncbi:hypothetical protein HPB52_002971 [Rhipicephalus sanguineus]|uniref:Uncharacterized protein n=1 Tax=Rhipicephalus sanguineus TaxID=34632 RepID=A0A9D4Q8S0_RHISA|nr:hypothetical protein HPB52_002971 [Rhipicephalus sanguineus]